MAKAVDNTIQTNEKTRRLPESSFESKQKLKYSVSGTKSIETLVRRWEDLSLVNLMAVKSEMGTSVRRRSIALVPTSKAIFESWLPQKKSDLLAEAFPVHVTPLMNEDNKWGCFYIFPELYADVYSPVVPIRDIKDIAPIEEGVLTRDLVTTCLSYLRRTPILGDYAYLKLNLSFKQLTNIDVLKYYKHLVYLDLSSNYLEQLTVLSHLPYLQHLSAAYNRLSTVLDYDTPQWFLSEVNLKFNSIRKISDLSAFWSITILDLSHNNIKAIGGLESLRYLRRLDLSFNHIQRLENLNHLRLLWLDVSYNSISNFEFGATVGLWTLLHLEYLNLNENNLTSLKMFSGCNRIRELHLRNNRLNILLELAVYMKQLRRLVVLDLRANPFCTQQMYQDVVINTFPLLLSLDSEELDPVKQRTLKMDMFPDVNAHATRRLLRLLYIQQLSRSLVSPYIPPADTTDVPIVVIVGLEAVGKGALVRRLTSECSANTELARQHTTATCHFSDHFIEISRTKFDNMLHNGDFLTYSEMDGESYGLSRSEAYTKDGRVRVASMDLVGALMLKLRGYRPYLILATTQNKRELAKRQYTRKTYRELNNNQQTSNMEIPTEPTLQVLVSGRIIITGILNEIILSLPDENVSVDFSIKSESSVMLDSEIRRTFKKFAKNIEDLGECDFSLQDTKLPQGKTDETSLYSLFKESQATEEYNSFVGYGQETVNRITNQSLVSQGMVFSKYSSSGWKGLLGIPTDSSKSTKSVTFMSQDKAGPSGNTTGLHVQPQADKPAAVTDPIHSISIRGPLPAPGQIAQNEDFAFADSDLWFAFLTETGQIEASENEALLSNNGVDDPQNIIRETRLKTIPFETVETLESSETLSTANLREEYESIHRRNPGLFWNTVCMDNPDEAFKKMRSIIRDIIESQSKLRPMFDIDFTNLSDYPLVKKKLEDIRKEIAPRQLFF